jgi:phosphatidylinositol-3-phosphatase
MRKNNTAASMLRLTIAILLMAVAGLTAYSQDILPKPDHIVIAIMENHAYGQIIGSDAAPFINALANGEHTALFSQSFGLGHPSQPNYLKLFSGNDQGVTDDELPAVNPFYTPNLARQLMDSGLSFVIYSEDLPEVGFNGPNSGEYVRKHNPLSNWMGTGEQQVPASGNQPFTAFPVNDFTLLPDVCFVVPNQVHNMHNGIDPDRIISGDSWVSNNLNSYIQWANTHNSLFILTWDEDNYASGNHIVTMFSGQIVKPGEYTDSICHYHILRTIEDMYGLPYAGNAAASSPVLSCWLPAAGIISGGRSNYGVSVYPIPSGGMFSIRIEGLHPGIEGNIEIFNTSGKRVYQNIFAYSCPFEIHPGRFPSGIYIVKVSDGFNVCTRKVIVGD